MTKNHVRRASAVAIVVAVVASGCGDVEQLVEETTGGTLDLTEVEEAIEEQTGSTIDLGEIDLSEVQIPDDINSPDFDIPDIVAPDIVAPEINIDIEQLIIEAPDIPVIRFPDAVTIEVPQVSSSAVTVAETPEETIYTIDGQVVFDFDRADLRPEAIDVLNEILAAIEDRQFKGTIEVGGHTDSTGTAEYNQGLSERRAAAVALWLRQRVPADQVIVAIGYGESQPIAPNNLPDGSDDPVGRTLNRRVEIIVNR